MNQAQPAFTRTTTRVVETNQVLRNTYALLSMTLLFSALCTGLSMTFDLPYPGVLLTLVGYFGLLFLVTKFRNSAIGLIFLFALTGFMGTTLGPILNAYIGHYVNGGQLVMTAMAGTGLTFLGLSAYALISRKDFSFLGGMLAAGILVAFLASLAGIFLPGLPGLSLAASAMFVILMSGMILFQTSEIIHGGETNYIMATLSLYIAIYNLFTSLLHLLGVIGGDD
jgi:modulator of FtsH protease